MGFNSEDAEPASIVFDVEAVAIDGAAEYLEPCSAPANFKDEAKIAAYIEQAQQSALERAALDVDLARVVALGVLGDTDAEPVVRLAHTEADEADLLRWFWKFLTQPAYLCRPTLIGYNCIGYDLPLLLRRSLYLGVPSPRLQMGKYRHDGIDDLMLSLSFDGNLKYRGLAFYCKRFGIDVPDETSGKDIAGFVAAGDWAAVERHCACDVRKTAALAQRVGVFTPRVERVAR